ncbi:MAG TPA: hypothetical protein VKV74_00215 [Bryobacteraceae bacterium]|nr:hypothetical protein [Bryobacteraceae bacterium]
MSSISRSDEPGARSQQATSFVWFEAETLPGVRYRIARMSLGRRIELARRVREIGRKLEFFAAGNDAREKLEAAVLQCEIDRAYLEWGLEAVEGLEIDGEKATPETLIERGPLDLAREILGKIRGECGLSETERKN